MLTRADMVRLFALLSFVVAPVAFAKPLEVAVVKGHTLHITLPSRVAKIEVEDPEKIQVKKVSGGVAIVGRESGTTVATVKMTDGSEHTVEVYVAVDRHALPY